MLVLTTYRTDLAISYNLYKIYQKKASLQVQGLIILQSPGKLCWEIKSSQTKSVKSSIVNISPNLTLTDDETFTTIIQHPNMNEQVFNIIIHKFSHGGDDYNGITLVTEQNLPKLNNLIPFAPKEQTADISLAGKLITYFPNAKHYGCFETAFHQTMQLQERMILPDWTYVKAGIKNYGTQGLAFKHLTNRLTDLADKKTAKGKWVYIYLSNNENLLCAVKNGKSVFCNGSSIHHDLPSCKNSGRIASELISFISGYSKVSFSKTYENLIATNLLQNDNYEIDCTEALLNSNLAAAKLSCEYLTSSISQSIMQLATILNGIDGIIFTGELGASNPKFRQLICDKLEWAGIQLSNKANLSNSCKLHKKSSKVEIFALEARPELAMLDELFERL